MFYTREMLEEPLCLAYARFVAASEDTPIGPIVSACENLEEAVRCFGLFPEEALRKGKALSLRAIGPQGE